MERKRREVCSLLGDCQELRTAEPLHDSFELIGFLTG